MSTSKAAAIHALLSADVDYAAVMIGGIYLRQTLPIELFSRAGTPAAYDSDLGLLLPCAVVVGRATRPFGEMRDPNQKTRSVAQTVEVWKYIDGASAASILQAAAVLEYDLLHDEQLSDGSHVELVNTIEPERDPEMNNAHFMRHDYEIVFIHNNQ